MATPRYDSFEWCPLGDEHGIWLGWLPASVREELVFEDMWEQRPAEPHRLVLYGKERATPRWQQAYGMDYAFSGNVSRARPLFPALELVLNWAHAAVDARLNGLLVNWYDARSEHYIGRHRDSPTGLIEDTPIVAVSLGAERIFRLRPWKARGRVDHNIVDGRVVIIPPATNRAWTHEVPHLRRHGGRRISVTLRGFAAAVEGAV